MKIKLLIKVSVWKIITAHARTLVNNNTKRPNFDDFFTFLIIPILLSAILIINEKFLNNETVTIIVTALSIFIGLLFNVIVLIFDIIRKEAESDDKIELLKQLLANISFEILLSILCIIITFFTYSKNKIFIIISNSLVYLLMGVFLMTLLMILKRMFVIFRNEIDSISQQ